MSRAGTVEVDGPDPVVGLFETNVLIDHRIGEIQQPGLKPEGSASGDLLHDEVGRILEGRQALGIRAGRGPIARRGRFLPQMFVRPLLIELLLEGIEVPLLRRTRGAHWNNCLALQGAVHAFMRARSPADSRDGSAGGRCRGASTTR
jgi:hypothetical protein